MAVQPNIADDYFRSKRAAFLNALKCKTGLIPAKAAANLETACLAPPPAPRPSARCQISMYAGSLAHELRPPRPQALLMVNIYLFLYGSMLGLHNDFSIWSRRGTVSDSWSQTR